MSKFSVLDLLDLPEQERRIMLYVARNDPVTVASIADATGYDMAAIETALAVLTAQARVQVWPDQWVTAKLGHVRPRTTLPDALHPQTASGRIYSEQEIATLRTAIPMLQFARARMATFNDHGPSHALRVGSFASQLGYALGLTLREHHLLHAGALFHDIGNVVDRARHHIIGQETVEKLATIGKLPFTPREAAVVGLLCRWHRNVKEYAPDQVDQVRGETVRTGLLAAILRVADAMDLDYRRADYDERFLAILRFFYPEEMPYWAAISALGVRIRCKPEIALQVFTKDGDEDNMLIHDLRKDLASTPLDWKVQTLTLDPSEHGPSAGTALLIFPFDAHSLVMAALSRQQLEAAGYSVECLCYPETTHAAAWLWQDAVPDINLNDFNRLVVIGDRPDSAIAAVRLDLLRQWRTAGKAVTLLNRHEHTWADLPQLLGLGVDIVLGGDWAYFWGDQPGAAAITWGRVAALCTRDATMGAGVTAAGLQLCQGLLAIVFDALRQRANTTAGWLALAEPILEQIAGNADAAVRRQAEHFRTSYAEAVIPGQVHGKVIVFNQAPGCLPPANYWALESAVERQGRKLERGIHFVTPYAVATWLDGDEVELLAINHWREEQAIPIRLLYPADLGPQPQGNANSLYVRLSAAQAASVVEALIGACNQTEE